MASSREGGGEKYVKRHLDRGKLLPRERIELLLDRDSYFLELLPLAGSEVDGDAPGASMIGGIGLVSGVECLIIASDQENSVKKLMEMIRDSRDHETIVDNTPKESSSRALRSGESSM